MTGKEHGISVGVRRWSLRRSRGLLALVAALAVAALWLSAVAAASPMSANTADDKTIGDRRLYAGLIINKLDADKDRVEPHAGTWHTWVLSSGSQIVPPAPPEEKATREEIKVLRQLELQRDDAVMDRIEYWNSGAPVYRWSTIATSEMVNRGMNSMMAGRNLALVHAAVSDATVAAWHAKYLYERKRPSEFDGLLKPAIDVPHSPSYPAEHAVAAGAASEVLAYIFPDRAADFRAMASEAADAFTSAGINYPSDVQAGLELGRQVAALVVERGKSDGSNVPWNGTVPTGPCLWKGQNPALPQAANWKTWVLSSPSEFRPAAPLPCDSAEYAAELAEVKNFQRTPRTNTLAQFWEYGAGGTRNYWFWNDKLSAKLFEYKLDNNPPAAARAYALQNIAYHDAVVGCWDAKYTYWAIRPSQFDATLQPLFGVPGHPSYPSAHSCLSGAASEVLAYLFPYAGDSEAALTEQAGEARIWAGLHFRMDVAAGLHLGEQVAAKAISVVSQDKVQK
jgi:hypothetical protein